MASPREWKWECVRTLQWTSAHWFRHAFDLRDDSEKLIDIRITTERHGVTADATSEFGRWIFSRSRQGIVSAITQRGEPVLHFYPANPGRLILNSGSQYCVRTGCWPQLLKFYNAAGTALILHAGYLLAQHTAVLAGPLLQNRERLLSVAVLAQYLHIVNLDEGRSIAALSLY